MDIAAVSRKANMNVDTRRIYYHKYFKEQHPDISTPSHIKTPKYYTQEQIQEIISYIVDDKMAIATISRKVNVDPSTARAHYRQYLKGNNMEIPVPKNKKRCTQEINQLIRYIMNDKMSVKAASKQANMGYSTGRWYYQQI